MSDASKPADFQILHLSLTPSPTKRPLYTASSLLNAFNGRPSPTSARRQQLEVLEQMGRPLRVRNGVSYVISDDSDAVSTPASSNFASPIKLARRGINDEEGEEESADELLDETSLLKDDRNIPGGRDLRPRSKLHPRATILYQKKRYKKPRGAKKTVSQGALRTDRAQIRHEIQTVTRAKRDKFLLTHEDLFLPLLPPGNYIEKLSTDTTGSPYPFTKYEEILGQPDGVVATMKPYQLEGLSFLAHLNRNGMPGILGDEMGLGKTLQTLSLFQYLKENEATPRSGEARPSLVVCPLSVLSNWVDEARKFTPGLKILRFHGPPSERGHLKAAALGRDHTSKSGRKTVAQRRNSQDVKMTSEVGVAAAYDIIVTTYETYLSEASWFKTAFVWRYLVLDEGHKIKNHTTDISKGLQGLKAEYRLLLTGTPLQNDLTELWSLLHWLLPDVFSAKTRDIFKQSFDLGKGQVNLSVLDHSKRLLESVMLRRMKDSDGVNLNLPPKKEVRIYVPLTPFQRRLYTQLLTRETDPTLLEEVFRGAQQQEIEVIRDDMLTSPTIVSIKPSFSISKDENAGTVNNTVTGVSSPAPKSLWMRLRNLVMQLRRCSTHPYLIAGIAPEPNYVGGHVVDASGKFMALEKLLRELVVKQDKKMLIFSNFTDVLDWCEDLLMHVSEGMSKFDFLRLDGSTAAARRNLNIKLFKDSGFNYQVMLISTKAGGLGINLTAATEAVFMDEDWNPQVDLQAEARCHRIGQTKPVTIYKLCSRGTVEEQMLGRIRKKLYLATKITEAMQTDYSSPEKAQRPGNAKLMEEKALFGSTTALKSLIRRGAQTLAHPEIDIEEMQSWDFDTFLSKCGSTSDELEDEGTSADEAAWLATMEKVECAVFDGQRYARGSREERVSMLLPAETTRQDRRIGKNTTVMIDGFAISKESLNCADWEAVPTLAGKDPRLAEPKRAKRTEVINQEHCILCYDGGELILCSGCPRGYHSECLGKEAGKNALKTMNWYCPQHHCHDCGKKAAEAGGMLFACRWCGNGFCEDCQDWDRTTLIGDQLDEYTLLKFPKSNTQYYVVCSQCNERIADQPELVESFDEQDKMYRAQLFSLEEQRDGEQNFVQSAGSPPCSKLEERLRDAPIMLARPESRSSLAPSLTDTGTISVSGVSTPRDGTFTGYHMPKNMKANQELGGKRKAADVNGFPDPDGGEVHMRSVKAKLDRGRCVR